MQRYTTLRRTRSVELVETITIIEEPVVLAESSKMRTKNHNPKYLERIEEQDELEEDKDSEVSEENESEFDEVEGPDAVDSLGYRWGPNCQNKYWTLWTIWEPHLFKTLEQFSRLDREQFCRMKIEEFETLVNSRIQSICSDRDFQIISTPESVSIMLRIEPEPSNKPYNGYNPKTGRVELESTEIFFNESQGTLSARFRKTYIVACSGLAEMLSAVCNPKDLLIITGSYVRTYRSDGSYFLLLNFDNCEGELQIIRISLTSKYDDEVRVIEKIKPSQQESRFLFKYFATSPNYKRSTEVSIHQNFTLLGTASFRQFSKRTIPPSDFYPPIRDAHDIFDIYRILITAKQFQSPSSAPSSQIAYPGKTTSFSQSPDPDLNDYDYGNTKYQDAATSPCDDPYAKDMPVFSMKGKSVRFSNIPVFRNDRSSTQKSELKHRRSGERHKSKRSDLQSRLSRFKQLPFQQWKTCQWEKFVDYINYDKTFKAFTFAAKVALLIFLCVVGFALYNIIFPSPNFMCPPTVTDSTIPKVSSETGLTNASTFEDILKNGQAQSVLVMFKDMLRDLFNWIEEHCGILCILNRIKMGFSGSSNSSNGPIV